MRLREFDNEKLAKYKTAAAADAKKADAEGDFARGNKRFKGINTATKKQFANDAKKSQLKEFAPSDDGEGPDSDEVLRRIAAHWWNGTEQQMIRAEQTLAAMGWEIGEDEGYDDGGVFVVRAGDDQGDSYISWPHEDLQMNEGIAGDMKYELDEAAQGHTIEAHGVRGMDRRTWHKTFRNTDQMIAWAEKHDAEIIGTRDLEQARHHNLSPAKAKGVAEGSEQQWTVTVGTKTGGTSHTMTFTGTKEQAIKKAVARFGTSKNPVVNAVPAKQSVAEAQTDYQKRRQRERDVDAGKPVKPEPKNPQNDYFARRKKEKEQGVAEGSDQQLSIRQLATISDEALDKAYGYGRSSPGNTFGWQANLKSASYAKHMIDKGVTDIDKIADAIHKGWNVTAKAFVKNPDRFDDTEKLKAAGKLEAKLQQRAKLMNIDYSQLPNDEQEKDRVVARALLQAITGGGEQGMAEGRQIDEMFADQGSGSTDRDNADYMKRRNAAKKAGYTGRETKAGTWRVFKDGNAVAAAGPFKSADEAAAWIKKHKQGITEMDKSEPSAGRDGGPREGPEKIAKPITKEKMVKRALDALSKSMAKKDDKKKDVAEDSLAAMRRLAGIVPQVPAVVSNGPRQYRHMPTAVQPR